MKVSELKEQFDKLVSDGYGDYDVTHINNCADEGVSSTWSDTICLDNHEKEVVLTQGYFLPKGSLIIFEK